MTHPRLHFIFVFILLLAVSCNENNISEHKNYFNPEKQLAVGHATPKDSMAPPKVISGKLPVVVKAGEPIVVPANQNVIPAGEPLVIPAAFLSPNIPGKDSFALPQVIAYHPAAGIPVGTPDMVVAKDMMGKDQNPANFNFYKTIQGLKHNTVRCAMQDKVGNLWFGLYAGGVCKYDGKSFTSFTEKEGLVNNLVYAIHEDRNGNIWIATGRGVSRYDGKYFTNLTMKDGLPEDIIWSIAEDKKGNIWLGTNGGGVSCFDGKSFTNFSKKQGLAANEVFCITEDHSGNLWFGTYKGGVSKYDGKSFVNFSKEQGLADNTIHHILEDRKGNIWFGGNSAGISKYDGKTFTNYSQEQGLVNNSIWQIMEDSKGDFWFATGGGGISCFDGKQFANYSVEQGLMSNNVYCIMEDRSGNIWLGTGGGVARYSGKIFSNFTVKEGLPNNVVQTILEDQSGNTWFGTNNGGLARYDGKSFSTFAGNEGLAANSVQCSLKDKKGNLWFGTYGGGVSCYDGKSFLNYNEEQGMPTDNVVNCMLEDHAGNLWFGSNGGGICKYDGTSFSTYTVKQGLPGQCIYSIAEDKSGKIWIGTNGDGLTCYDPEATNGKTFVTYTKEDGLAGNIVSSILLDKEGIMWFGTNSGLSRYDGKYFTNFTEKEGLASNAVSSSIEDKEGNLWFGTRMGLSKINFTTLPLLKDSVIKTNAIFYNYGYNDGFSGLNCRRGSVAQDSSGTIWWGADVLMSYSPGNDRVDTNAAVVKLTGIKLFGEAIPWSALGAVVSDSTGKEIVNGTIRDTTLANGIQLKGIRFDGISKWNGLPEQLSLPYNNNNVAFNFVGVHMQSHNYIKYQYKLEGMDADWSSVTQITEAPYGNLPGGNYIFKVRAMNQSGTWSAPSEFAFTVRPPWWQTWWFRISVLLAIIFSVVGFFRYRTAALRRDKEILERTVEERTSEVVEQKHIIEEKQKDILDSINYAQRIQRALLATDEMLKQNLPPHFVFYQPKDIVSGDFYWAADLSDNKFALVTADSTGHGVPGAIMSMLNISCLEKSVEFEKLAGPAEILNHTRTKIIKTLAKDGSESGGKDGMDCSLVSFDFKNKTLAYAAANNPVWIVRNKSMIELAPDKMPVGKHDKDTLSFSQKQVELERGDMIYTLTDGYADQFGGPKGKKFMYTQLKQLLISISVLPVEEQKNHLAKTLADWKGSLEQVDDILLIGVQFN